jgi:hypothetical protein
MDSNGFLRVPEEIKGLVISGQFLHNVLDLLENDERWRLVRVLRHVNSSLTRKDQLFYKSVPLNAPVLVDFLDNSGLSLIADIGLLFFMRQEFLQDPDLAES